MMWRPLLQTSVCAVAVNLTLFASQRCHAQEVGQQGQAEPTVGELNGEVDESLPPAAGDNAQAIEKSSVDDLQVDGGSRAEEAGSPNASSEPDEVPGIVITARRRATEEQIDRTTYEISAGPEAASASTLDVLKRLPGVFVGPSGGVTIRGGARVSYLVDGRPVRREVALGIPAGQIERVELIPNPPAEYDSSSEALINLVLKRNADAGWSGSGSGEVDTLGGYRTGMDAALGTGEWNLNGSISYRSLPLRTLTLRTTAFSFPEDGFAGLTQILSTDENRRTKRLSGQLKGFRKSSESNSTSLLVGASYNQVPQTQDVIQSSLTSGGAGTRILLRRDLDFNGFYPYANVNITRRLDSRTSLDVSLQVNYGDSRDLRATFGDIRQLVIDDINFAFIEPSLKFSRKLASGQLSIGLSYSVNPVRERLGLSGTPDLASSADTAFDFRFDRGIYAAYAEFEGVLLGVGVKPSIRFERLNQTFRNFDVTLNGLQSVSRLLPSIHLSKKIKDRNTIKASFTSRTDRPDGLNLNPFITVVSPFFVKTGNPFLRPSVKGQFDLSYIYERSGISVNQSLYYRSTRDDISEFLLSDDLGVTTRSFTNLGSSKSFGYTATVKGNITRNLQFSAGADIYHREIVAPITLSELGRIEFETTNFNGTVDYTVDDKTSVSAQLSYIGPVFDLGIKTPRYFTSELQVKRALSKQLSFTILLADALIPLERVGQFEGLNLIGSERIRPKTRLIRIGLASKF